MEQDKRDLRTREGLREELEEQKRKADAAEEELKRLRNELKAAKSSHENLHQLEVHKDFHKGVVAAKVLDEATGEMVPNPEYQERPDTLNADVQKKHRTDEMAIAAALAATGDLSSVIAEIEGGGVGAK